MKVVAVAMLAVLCILCTAVPADAEDSEQMVYFYLDGVQVAERTVSEIYAGDVPGVPHREGYTVQWYDSYDNPANPRSYDYESYDHDVTFYAVYVPLEPESEPGDGGNLILALSILAICLIVFAVLLYVIRGRR